MERQPCGLAASVTVHGSGFQLHGIHCSPILETGDSRKSAGWCFGWEKIEKHNIKGAINTISLMTPFILLFLSCPLECTSKYLYLQGLRVPCSIFTEIIISSYLFVFFSEMVSSSIMIEASDHLLSEIIISLWLYIITSGGRYLPFLDYEVIRNDVIGLYLQISLSLWFTGSVFNLPK